MYPCFPNVVQSGESVRANYGSFLASVFKIPSHWYKDMGKRAYSSWMSNDRVSSQGWSCVLKRQSSWETSTDLTSMLCFLLQEILKSVSASKGNAYPFIMWSPAVHHITVTFSGFLYFDCLLSYPPHSSKVTEAKQERNKKVSQWNTDLLTKPKECRTNSELKILLFLHY